MTVAIGVVSGDGVVLAADSRTTFAVAPNTPTRVLSDYTHKVFRLGRCGAVTYGWAFLNRRHVSAHAESLSREVPDDAPVSDVAQIVCDRFADVLDAHLQAGYDPAPPDGVDVLGFLIGGYDDSVGKTIQVSLPSRSIELQHSTDNPGAAWRGQTDVIRRLVKGVDVEALEGFAQQDGVGQALQDLRDTLPKLEYLIPFQAMNLQDSIDFASFAIRLTIDTQRLTHGLIGAPGSWPGVGGPIEMAVITASRGFVWLSETQLQAERQLGEPEMS